MLIGELADAVGLPAETFRYYERRGLLADISVPPELYRTLGSPEGAVECPTASGGFPPS